MKPYIKIGLVWTMISVLCSPLVGWGLGKSDMHPILAVYLVMIFALAPCFFMVWNEFFCAAVLRSSRDNSEARQDG